MKPSDCFFQEKNSQLQQEIARLDRDIVTWQTWTLNTRSMADGMSVTTKQARLNRAAVALPPAWPRAMALPKQTPPGHRIPQLCVCEQETPRGTHRGREVALLSTAPARWGSVLQHTARAESIRAASETHTHLEAHQEMFCFEITCCNVRCLETLKQPDT